MGAVGWQVSSEFALSIVRDHTPVDALEHQHGARDLRDEIMQLDHRGVARDGHGQPG